MAGAALRAVELLTAEPQRRTTLLDKATTFRDRLRAAGLDLGAAAAQIVPVIVGSAEGAVALAARLADEGLFVPAIRPPSVPAGGSLVRASLACHHTDDDLDRLARALSGSRE